MGEFGHLARVTGRRFHVRKPPSGWAAGRGRDTRGTRAVRGTVPEPGTPGGAARRGGRAGPAPARGL